AGVGGVVGEDAAGDGQRAVRGHGAGLGDAARAVAACYPPGQVVGERAAANGGDAVVFDPPAFRPAAPPGEALAAPGEGQRAQCPVVDERGAGDGDGAVGPVVKPSADAVGRVVRECVIDQEKGRASLVGDAAALGIEDAAVGDGQAGDGHGRPALDVED